MLTRIKPEIGCWYEDLEQNALFEVVSPDDDSVGIQYFYEEIELESFLKLPLQTVDQPEDWSGPCEIDAEDLDDEYNQGTDQSNYRFDGYDSGSMQILEDY